MSKRRRALVLAIAAVTTLMSVPLAVAERMTYPQYLAMPRLRADHRIPYGSEPSQFGELWLPPGEVSSPMPVVVLLHGGCWQVVHDLGPMTGLADALRRLGLAVWSVEFRRVGEKGGGWPGTFEDVATGADFLKSLVPQFNLDLKRVVVVGHSSGGHLAMWLAMRSRVPRDSAIYRKGIVDPIAAVVLAGIPDMAAAIDSPMRRSDPKCLSANIDVMGGRVADVPNHYNAGSPINLLPAGIPHYHLVGTDDSADRRQQIRAFVDSARRLGDAAALVELRGAGHFDVVNPADITWPIVRNLILLSLDATGKSPQSDRRRDAD